MSKAIRIKDCNACPYFVDMGVNRHCLQGNFNVEAGFISDEAVHKNCPLKDGLTLYASEDPNATPPRTVLARIAVAVDEKGHWNSCGWYSGKEVSDKEKMSFAEEVIDSAARYWVDVVLKVPKQNVVDAAAKPADPEG